jgi:phosphatidate cytidylyltransferase
MSGPVTRITIGSVLTVLVAGLLVTDTVLQDRLSLPWAPIFWPLLLVVLGAGCYELTHMMQLKGLPVRPALAALFTGLIVAAAWHDSIQTSPAFSGDHYPGWPYVCVLAGLVLVTFLVEIMAVGRRGVDPTRAAEGIGLTLLAVMSVGFLGVFVAKVRTLSPDPWQGLMYLALLAGTVKVGDIGAYTVGSIFGRHPLVPRLSPKKSWEGLVGGLASGTGAAMLIGCLWGGLDWLPMLIFGLVVGAAGVLGDLAESLLKRACGVKDSGPIPGFGGVLDILDSILGAAPIAYLLLVVLIR